jgi:hypothetical protein
VRGDAAPAADGSSTSGLDGRTSGASLRSGASARLATTLRAGGVGTDTIVGAGGPSTTPKITPIAAISTIEASANSGRSE